MNVSMLTTNHRSKCRNQPQQKTFDGNWITPWHNGWERFWNQLTHQIENRNGQISKGENDISSKGWPTHLDWAMSSHTHWQTYHTVNGAHWAPSPSTVTMNMMRVDHYARRRRKLASRRSAESSPPCSPTASLENVTTAPNYGMTPALVVVDETMVMQRLEVLFAKENDATSQSTKRSSAPTHRRARSCFFGTDSSAFITQPEVGNAQRCMTISQATIQVNEWEFEQLLESLCDVIVNHDAW